LDRRGVDAAAEEVAVEVDLDGLDDTPVLRAAFLTGRAGAFALRDDEALACLTDFFTAARGFDGLAAVLEWDCRDVLLLVLPTLTDSLSLRSAPNSKSKRKDGSI
jgi:hypothetical protein